MAAILTCLAYLIACFEKCVKSLNKNAYIQCALHGTKFCTSAKEAFMLILRNAGRIGVLGLMGVLTNFLGKVVIMSGTGVLGYFILNALNPNDLTSIVAPCLIFVMIGYCVGCMVMNVFAMSVDTVLQCFVADEELTKGSDRSNITPKGLAPFLPKQRNDKPGCCWCCAKKKGDGIDPLQGVRRLARASVHSTFTGSLSTPPLREYHRVTPRVVSGVLLPPLSYVYSALSRACGVGSLATLSRGSGDGRGRVRSFPFLPVHAGGTPEDDPFSEP